jgi:hypothetical protein
MLSHFEAHSSAVCMHIEAIVCVSSVICSLFLRVRLRLHSVNSLIACDLLPQRHSATNAQ